MAAGVLPCLIFLLGLLSCSGEVVKESEEQPLFSSQTDVINPVTTVPVINPSNTAPPTTTNPIYNPYPRISSPATPTLTPFANPASTPTMLTPSAPSSSGGQSWCVASQSASATALQVALDYACGYGGADCSAIQSGGSCFNPDTVRDHASYAFNDYYQKNPIPTSCDFGGTAVATNVDPSSSTCHYPSTSTSSSTLNTTYPGGSPVVGGSPDIYGSGSVPPATTTTTTTSGSALTRSSLNSLLIAMTGLLLSLSSSGVRK